jgi:hypothetical protein
MDDLRLDFLPPVASPSLAHVFPAMGGGIAGRMTLAQVLAGFHVAAAITTPADGDEFGFLESGSSWSPKRITWGSVKTAIASAVMTLTNKTISGGSVTGITDLAIADGGTGQSTAANAFNALKQVASPTATGVVELATAAEVAAGTDTARVPSVATMGSHQGMLKAWVNFNGTGTVAIRDSYNVSSITDNGTGAYTINFATAMPNANYGMIANAGHSSGGGYVRLRDGSAPAVGSIAIDTLQFNGGGLIDHQYVFAAFFGD